MNDGRYLENIWQKRFWSRAKGGGRGREEEEENTKNNDKKNKTMRERERRMIRITHILSYPFHLSENCFKWDTGVYFDCTFEAVFPKFLQSCITK